ncbi:MAG: hypothetical protein NVS4B8_18310 [Herpetosiphon sp.]
MVLNAYISVRSFRLKRIFASYHKADKALQRLPLSTYRCSQVRCTILRAIGDRIVSECSQLPLDPLISKAIARTAILAGRQLLVLC